MVAGGAAASWPLPPSASSHKAYREWLSAVSDSIAVRPEFEGTGVRIHFAVADVDPERLDSRKLFESVRLGPLADGLEKLERVDYRPAKDLERTVNYHLVTNTPRAFLVGEAKSRTMLVVPVIEGRQTEMAIYSDDDGWLHVSFYAPKAGTDRDRKALHGLGKAQCHLAVRNADAARTEIDRCSLPVALTRCALPLGVSRLDRARQRPARQSGRGHGPLRFPDRYVVLANLAEDDKQPRNTIEGYYRKGSPPGCRCFAPISTSSGRGPKG